MTTNRMVARASRLRILLAIGLAVGGASCASRPVTLGQTQIGQGKLYQSGSVTYDRFFQDTHAMQLEVMRADEDEAAARAPLEKALNARNASLDKLYDLAVMRAKKGVEDGPPLVYVIVNGLDTNKESKEPKEAAENGEAAKEPKEPAHDVKELPNKVTVQVLPLDTAPADQKAFLKALGETIKDEAEILDRFGSVTVKAGQLSTLSDELSDGVDKEFSARKLRKDVNQELGAAKLILGATEQKAREVSSRARTFLKGMSEALKPPAEVTPPPPPPPVEKPEPVKTTRPRRGGGAGTTTAKPAKPEEKTPTPHPDAKPKPAKPKPAEDFNP
jgi:hypothetical protein